MSKYIRNLLSLFGILPNGDYGWVECKDGSECMRPRRKKLALSDQVYRCVQRSRSESCPCIGDVHRIQAMV
jgi:hypothetical protein